jgi:hypothetical protein
VARTTYTDGSGRQITTGGYAALTDGRAITAKVRQDLQRLAVEMSYMAQADHHPAEYRARVRSERTTEARELRAEARAAMAAWADKKSADARRRLATRPLGDAAEESRRVANELRINRIVDGAHRNGTVRADAEQLAERADAAYIQGNLDEAEILATAAKELSPVRLAEEVIVLVDYDRVAADPERWKASRDLEDVSVVEAAFERDSNAAYSASMRDSLALAQKLGQHDAEAQREMTQASIGAKMAAAVASATFDVPYVEPIGVTPGGVQDLPGPHEKVIGPDGQRA